MVEKVNRQGRIDSFLMQKIPIDLYKHIILRKGEHKPHLLKYGLYIGLSFKKYIMEKEGKEH